MKSLIRQALDELLRRFPDKDVMGIDWQLPRPVWSESVPQRIWSSDIEGPWVRVMLRPNQEYVIWKNTGAIYKVGTDGAVPDDPIWEPNE